MLAQHGWKSKPSPRRGFTVVEASREPKEAPVVVAVHQSKQALRLFRSALDEAMTRSQDLVVLDFGSVPLREELDESKEVDAREMRAMRALWTNPHVRCVRVESTENDLETTIGYCESMAASLLILGADDIRATSIDAKLAERIFNGDFDVLVVTDHPKEDRLLAGASDEE